MFDTYCKMDSLGPAVGETTSVVVQRTEGSHRHSFVAGWFVSVIEVLIAMVSWFHHGQRIGIEKKIFTAESSFTVSSSGSFCHLFLEPSLEPSKDAQQHSGELPSG